MTEKTIPPLVTATLSLHAAQTAHQLEQTRAQLDGEGVTTLVSRRLRSRRERLTAELEAWQYLVRVARGNALVDDRCACGHTPHAGDICGVVACVCEPGDGS